MAQTDGKPFTTLLAELRACRPLVHNVTNFVVMNFTANVLLAVGASPVMAHAPEEVADFVGVSGALVVNMGTIDSSFLGSMELAIRKARKKGVPWVLDPVGIGATRFRQRTGRFLAKWKPVDLSLYYVTTRRSLQGTG
jgi:hydroxyethylthiazole kinase